MGGVHSIRRGAKSLSEMVINRRTHNADSISQSKNIYFSSKWLYTYRNPIDRRYFQAVHFPGLRSGEREISLMDLRSELWPHTLSGIVFGRGEVDVPVLYAYEFAVSCPLPSRKPHRSTYSL